MFKKIKLYIVDYGCNCGCEKFFNVFENPDDAINFLKEKTKNYKGKVFEVNCEDLNDGRYIAANKYIVTLGLNTDYFDFQYVSKTIFLK